MTPKVYSFDIYDTCLVRNIAQPTDLFEDLADKVLPNWHERDREEKIAELVRYRLEAELELEYRSVRPITSIKNKIQQLRHDNHRIIFISDMYLPTELIRKMLVNAGVALPDDPIYVSGEMAC